MYNLEKFIKEIEEEYDNFETESAPSGEWEEYNVAFLQHRSYLEGLKDAFWVTKYDKIPQGIKIWGNRTLRSRSGSTVNKHIF